LTDFIVMVKRTSFMFITGPDVIRAVTGEQVDFESLGGADVQNMKSGVAHFAADDEEGALELVKQLLGYLPQNNAGDPPAIPTQDDPARADSALNGLVPEDSSRPYDMLEAIHSIFDADSFFEVQPQYALNAIVGFARLDGHAVGVVANQPAHLAGVLDIDSADKISRFVRFCDAFNFPIVTFVDSPGFLPGVGQEHGGIIRHGAKVIYAYCEATVPKISIVCRKAVGGAYIAMSSKMMRSDLAFAWPTAEIAVMGAEGAVNILYRSELKNAEDPRARRQELVQAYTERFATPYAAAEMGFVDEVIEPATTRPRLIAALDFLRTKAQANPPKKHGNIPL
ncbi:MAG TPA: carboxyl transferase domain-containing protein, partial [Anaerolineae bacterium]